MSKKILVGISTYNDTTYLELLLQSIRWYTFLEDPTFDLVVCDDGSGPEALDYTRKQCEKFGAVLLENGYNQGIPATWNHLTNALGAESEIVILLNNDLLVTPNWLRVAEHFLRVNKNNPHVGSCFWNPVNNVSLDTMRNILPLLGHTVFLTQDLVSGKERDFYGAYHTEVRIGHGHGLGRVMCPCGCCFAFRREVYNECGPFLEKLLSFHEESLFGTTCAKHGKASFGFPYPRPYHTHGATFARSPELNASDRMSSSRKIYRDLWEVPDSVGIDKYFDYVNQKFMPLIPETEMTFLSPNYDVEPEIRTLPGGERVKLPALVEKTVVC